MVNPPRPPKLWEVWEPEQVRSVRRGASSGVRVVVRTWRGEEGVCVVDKGTWFQVQSFCWVRGVRWGMDSGRHRR